MPKNLNDKQKRALANMEPEGVPSLDVIKQRLAGALDEMTPDFIKGTSENSPVPPRKTGNRFQFESDKNVLGAQRPQLGDVGTANMSTEDVQKAQNVEQEKQKLQDYLEMRKKLEEPPMMVPKARDPRLQNPENMAKFEAEVKRLKALKEKMK